MTNNGKAKIEKTNGGLSILIPSKKNWFGLIFGTVWLGGWYFGVTTVIPFTSSENGHVDIDSFLIIWLIIWIGGGLTIIVLLLWGYFGKEKFILNHNEVLFEKTVFDLGSKKRLVAKEIKNFRKESGNDKWSLGNRWAFWGLGPAKIAFDYGLKTFSFGLAVDDAEANYIVGILKEHFQNEANSERPNIKF